MGRRRPARCRRPAAQRSQRRRSVAGACFTRNAARSVAGSVPTTRASATMPSGSITAISSAPSITWLLVRLSPCLATITPKPRLAWPSVGSCSESPYGRHLPSGRWGGVLRVYTLTTDAEALLAVAGAAGSGPNARHAMSTPAAMAMTWAASSQMPHQKQNRQVIDFIRIGILGSRSEIGGSSCWWRCRIDLEAERGVAVRQAHRRHLQRLTNPVGRPLGLGRQGLTAAYLGARAQPQPRTEVLDGFESTQSLRGFRA